MSSAREALIAEALGDVGALLDRVEMVSAALQDTCQAVVQASADLKAETATANRSAALVMENATTQALRHMARRSDEIARAAAETETRAMEAAARKLFKDELAPAFNRLARSLGGRAETPKPFRGSPAAHAVTAIAASAATWTLAVFLLTP
ncbi:uncharacterized protein (DUF885 family) [Pelomonas saccharophila]|uniref:Uncharacterized protein (DUF885 family) n=1 Tax=Roseateles saccharophilus TaxID=304 RepID=A0ABU1YGH2_ROSSA|nr:hypothetical protein [Roseateles saccharophilus]MDR7267838.1 uncharacterized protein (DUF885 family) [Roseateles saccharophilus]